MHGDAHIQNVMIADGEPPVLIDLEAFAWGIPGWDLAKTAAEASMGMYSDRDYAAFTAAYGYDLTTWSGFPVVQAVMQVKMVTWMGQNVDHSPMCAPSTTNGSVPFAPACLPSPGAQSDLPPRLTSSIDTDAPQPISN